MSYDSAIITLILIVDSYALFLNYKRDTKRKIARKFSKLMRKLQYAG